MTTSSMKKNWRRFRDHPDYGGAIKHAGLPNKMPSARFLDTFRPYWVKFTRGMIYGANEQLYAAKRNYVVLRKLAIKTKPEAAQVLPELFIDWLKSLLRDVCQTEGADRYACETLRCRACHPRRIFHQNADTGVTVLETMSKITLTPDERSSLELPFYFMGKEVADLKSLDSDGNPKQWIMKKLDSRECDFDSWLKQFQEQIIQAWDYYWTMRFQALYQKQRKMDGQAGWFPLNGIIIWRDFSLNVKRYGSQCVTPQQSRNPKEFSNENYLVYIPKPRASVDDPVEFDVHCIHVLGESGKHDTYTGAVNIRKVLEVLERKGLWKHDDIEVKRVFLQSDGASKEYKSANAFALLKEIAKKYNLAIMLDFYGSGNGKGLIDGVGGVFCRGYHSDGTKALGLDARHCNKIAIWVDTEYHEFEEAEKISRMKVNFKPFKCSQTLVYFLIL